LKLSVVILNYNVRYFLELCLKSVQDAIKGIDAEIIVVDNKSSDDSCAMIRQLFPNVTLIENQDNYGFSKGNNIGVAKAKGEYLCILNPDTVVAQDTFKKTLEFATSKSDCGIVGCQLIDGRGVFLPESKREVPTPKVAFQKLLGKVDNYYTNTLPPDGVGRTDVLVGAFMVLKRSVYNEVKGFDEDYFMYGEDIDLSYKILKSGYSNYYYGKTTVIHFKGESTLKDKIYAQRFYGAMGIFYRKHFASNSIMTALVKLALKLVAKKGNYKESKSIDVSAHILISNSVPEELKTKLGQSISSLKNLNDDLNNTQIIFDISYLGCKSIIVYMKKHHITRQNTYRFLLKNSNFIIGSDSNISKGEVMSLDF